MMRYRSPMHAIFASMIALSFSIGIMLPMDAEALDLFKWLKRNEKVDIKKAELTPVERQEIKLARNVKLVNNMRAFRLAPTDLKDLVAAIITSSEIDTLMDLNIRQLKGYKDLQRTLDTAGLKSIRTSLIRAKGTKFKTALILLLSAYTFDPDTKSKTKVKIITLLKKASLMPYYFGQRHQFVALIALKAQMNRPMFRVFVNEFIKTHRDGKDSKLQLAAYMNTLKQMKIDEEQNTMPVK